MEMRRRGVWLLGVGGWLGGVWLLGSRKILIVGGEGSRWCAGECVVAVVRRCVCGELGVKNQEAVTLESIPPWLEQCDTQKMDGEGSAVATH